MPELGHVLDGMADHIAILDAGGQVVTTNQAWDAFAEANDGRPGPGVNYLAVTRQAAEAGDEIAAKVAEGLAGLLDGQGEPFELDYPCHGPEEEERWFRLSAAPVEGEAGDRFVLVSHRSITTEHQATEEGQRLHVSLQERERLLDQITHALPQVVWAVGPEVDEILFVTRDAPDFWGLPADEILTDPLAWLPLVLAEDRAAVEASLAADVPRLLADPSLPVEAEFRINHGATGQLRWVRLQAAALTDQGETTGIAGIVEDVTERREADAERERLRQIVEVSPEGVGIATPDGQVEYLNPTFRQLMGLAPEAEVDNLSIDTFHPPETLERLVSSWIPQAIAEGSWQGESRLLTPEGEEIAILQTITAHEDATGEVSHLSTIVRDIRPLKAAEASLLSSERRFRELAEHVEEVFWMNDAAFEQTLYISPAYEEVWGRSRDELYEQPEAYLEGIHPEDRPRVEQALAGIADGGYDVTYRVVQPDGQVRWVHDRGFPIEGPDGGIVRFAGLAIDITEGRRDAEQRARQARASARAAELEQLIFATSHTLKTEVRRIASFGQLLRQRAGAGLEARLEEPLEEILGGAAQLARLHDALRKYAETTQARPGNTLVDLGAVAREVLAERSLEIDGLGGRSGVGEIPPVEGDRDQLRTLLAQLVDNAIAFQADRPIHVEVSAASRGDTIEVAVTDNGQGFDPAYSERIFGLFQTLDPRTGGVGVGLTICRRIVENHGGAIHAESQPGQGTTVRFTLPAAQGGSPRPPG